MTWQVLTGDCVEVMAEMAEASVDAIVTDPPYSLGFMGKEWDRNLNHGPWATQALRVLKPGAHLLAFGGTRTYHRLACALEDAGFEIRDCLAWLYGSGFPKSLDVSKAIDKAAGAEREVVGSKLGQPGYSLAEGKASTVNFGPQTGDPVMEAAVTAPATPDAQRWQGWGTALKPAFEPIVLARKPLAGAVAANVLEHGTGALNIDGTRIEGEPHAGGDHAVTIYGSNGNYESGPNVPGNPAGRWPANVLLDETSAALLDATADEDGGPSRFFRVIGKGDTETWSSGANTAELSSTQPSGPGASALGDAATSDSHEGKPLTSRAPSASTSATPSGSSKNGESGTPAIPTTEPRSSPVSPPGSTDPTSPANDAELPTLIGTTTTTPSRSMSASSAAPATSSTTPPSVLGVDRDGLRFSYVAKADREERNRGTLDRNLHPTVKPVELMQWLCRLVTPPRGLVLDPFLGSGSTAIAALREGFDVVGIEREPEYVAIARDRIIGDAPLFNVGSEAVAAQKGAGE